MLSIKRSSLACVSEASHHHYHLALSADTIASNADLLTEILLHLPIRLLFRFKSASKHWLSLITHPYFSHCHQILNRIPSGLFLQLHCSSRLNNPEYEFVSFNDPLTFTPPFRTLTIHYASYTGFWFSKTHCSRCEFRFQSCKIASLQSYLCSELRDLSSEYYQIEIYSSNTGPWRVSGQPFTAHVNIQFNGGVYWNGAIHWLSIWGDSLCFDVDKECLQIMPMPPLP